MKRIFYEKNKFKTEKTGFGSTNLAIMIGWVSGSQCFGLFGRPKK
jgi:hypothetical protein